MMKIFDENDVEIQNPDYNLGYCRPDQILVAHHEAVEAVQEVWHYRTVAEYPNGGRDVEKVVDVEGVEARDAYDEFEDILRYILYTEEELAAMEAERRKPRPDDDRDAMLVDLEYRVTLLELDLI